MNYGICVYKFLVFWYSGILIKNTSSWRDHTMIAMTPCHPCVITVVDAQRVCDALIAVFVCICVYKNIHQYMVRSHQ